VRFGSVCSGVEAASLAWEPLGWQCAFVCENAKFPAALLKYRFPSVSNFGDLTKFKEWTHAQIDLLVGGTPCQTFSLAGKRAGMDDPRGQLVWSFLGVAQRYRPRWIVWENVPGVLSSGGGKDFGSFLWALGQLGYGWAYRVLDAQYFGVPQRRRRVFVVGYLGDRRRAGAVLFEPPGLSGHLAPLSGEKEADTRDVEESPGDAGQRIAGCLRASRRLPGVDEARSNHLVVVPLTGVARSLTAHHSSRLDADSDNFVLAFHALQDPTTYIGKTPALGCGSTNGQAAIGVVDGLTARRLTPEECEGLMGMPRGWTQIPWRGKPAEVCPGGPRYAAIGNSMAVPVVRWIGQRIALVDSIPLATELV
jgi:DNA (cytosine-5)-methyltransferase 1